MRTRAEELRGRHRKVLGWALAVAAILHVGAFLLLPGLRVQSFEGSEVELEEVDAVGGAGVDVRFGPPTIRRADGTAAQEPPQRRLRVVRLVRLPAACDAVREAPEAGVTGSVRLRVDAGGHAKGVEIQESTGIPCADVVIVRLAGDLHYHWLPTEEFPAPVELVQPVTIVEAGDQ